MGGGDLTRNHKQNRNFRWPVGELGAESGLPLGMGVGRSQFWESFA
jgi:hypothetical protein